jgi:hypothetical protein
MLKLEERVGYVFDKTKQHYEHRDPNSLLVYCPICPERGVSLPKDWKSYPATYSYVKLPSTIDES